MATTPLLIAAGLPTDTAQAVRDATSPWGPLTVYEDIVEALMRLHQTPALLVVLPADRADAIAAAERLRDTRPDTVVVLIAEHGLSDRLLAHWIGSKRAHLALRAPITRPRMRTALGPLLPAVDEPDVDILAEEAALARAVAEQAGREAEEAKREAIRHKRSADETTKALHAAHEATAQAHARIKTLEAALEGATGAVDAKRTLLTALQVDLTTARAKAGHQAQELACAEAALEAALLDAQGARDQQITDIQWFMGELKRARDAAR